MKYTSTRDENVEIESKEAIAKGISCEGGLFVPESLPRYTHENLKALRKLNYNGRACYIGKDFLTDFTHTEIEQGVSKAYTEEKFDSGNPAPVVSLGSKSNNMNILELWHGPTCAFKDMALQMLPYLLTASIKSAYKGKTAVMLVATSGDTGKAALEGFKDVANTEMIVFYPEYGVSDMQKRQMETQEGNNVDVCAIAGNFDDAQTSVKKIFTDKGCIDLLDKHNMMFSSANSINWGRLLPQIVYYFSAYCDMLNAGTVLNEYDKINIAVPTGNFGNILAAYYAMKMGLPVNKLICASNFNNVLTDFIDTGTYNRKRHFYSTNSPSMDILVSSNLERLLFDLSDNDTRKIGGFMKKLDEKGEYTVDKKIFGEVQKLFFGAFCDDNKTCQTIRETFRNSHYLCDTHTAVAINAYGQYLERTGDSDTPTLVVSTASPYKFAPDVLRAVSPEVRSSDEFDCIRRLSEATNTEIPIPILKLKEKAVRFNNSITPDKMESFIFNSLNIG